ncbi:hypothetical protein RyT2_17370 [Pseudolactococcus yaeyamensis]
MNEMNFNRSDVWDIVKDDLENLPSKKKVQAELNDLAETYETVNAEFMALDIEELRQSVAYLEAISEEKFEAELQELVHSFQNIDENLEPIF